MPQSLLFPEMKKILLTTLEILVDVVNPEFQLFGGSEGLGVL